MKRFLTLAVLAAVVLCGFNSCDESAMGGVATYTGKVLNEYTDEPLEDASVIITNGDIIHASTKTLADGTFSVDVRLAEINKDYYILIHWKKTEEKKVEFPAYGEGTFDIGTITIKGPTKTPAILTTLVRVDSKTMVYAEGEVVHEGEAAVTERGICWGTSTPTIKNNKIECGEGKGGFSCNIEDAMDVHARNYYVRAYATNSFGTSYGETVMIDHRNPYNLFKLEDKGVSYLVLPYDLPNAEMSDRDYTSGNYAQQNCQSLTAYDYDDWDLPTIAVLELIYSKKDTIGGFTDQQYWSCSGGGDYHWWYINFSSGEKGYTYGCSYGVRPVRKY